MHKWLGASIRVGLLVGLTLGSAFAAAGAEEKKSASESRQSEARLVLQQAVSAPLEEVSNFGKPEPGVRFAYPRGQMVLCRDQAFPEVKAYPKLNSKRPLYGCAVLAISTPTVSRPYYFVLDESEAEPSKDAARAKVHYDRLYFDANGDLDLTNDKGVGVADKPSGVGGVVEPDLVVFNDLLLTVDYGDTLGRRPFALVPRLRLLSPKLAVLEFLPRVARQGTIRIDGQEFIVRLSQSRAVTGRFDRPMTEVDWVPRDGSSWRLAAIMSGSLGAIREVDKQLLVSSTTPLGDRFTVEPYRGECGLLEVVPGGRAITRLGVGGELQSRERIVYLGDRGTRQPEELARQIRVPVGDYAPSSLTVAHGRLLFTCRQLRTSGRLSTAQSALSTPTIKIRKDAPFRLEFSGKPDVVLNATSRSGKTFRPGETVRISALLTEPTQGIMITGLWNLQAKTGERTLRQGDATLSVPLYARLDPTVVIRNAKGETVATGKMPFG